METRWLEDFLSLAETGSFSRSAQLRHVTQPAFSRRIQSLEAWAGTDLVDRSSYPTRLTPAGQALLPLALEVLSAVQVARNTTRSLQASGQDVVEFAVPHTLAFTFFPHWVAQLRQQFGTLKTRLIALNVHDAVMRLAEGGCDLLIAYHHASQPLPLGTERYEMLRLGEETLAPYAQADDQGLARLGLPAAADRRVPLLGFSEGAYMSRLVEMILAREDAADHVELMHQTDMAEGLKAMALEGHGLAFLPQSSVTREMASGRLVRASRAGRFEVTMEIRIYRERPGLSRHVKPRASALWDFLATASGAARA